MRVLTYDADATPAEWGRHHGKTFAHEIRTLAELRTRLCVDIGAFEDADAVRAVATPHLEVLERFAPELHAELMGIAEGAGVSPEAVVILNHYTDLRDLVPGHLEEAAWGEEGCSALWADTPAGPVLAQTWDMHASAMPFVMMLEVPARDGRPAARLLSLTGCLGMCGMNDAGVGITINNLRSSDATVGAVWSALVRRVLWEGTAEAAQKVVMDSPIGSGHHYLVAGPDGATGIETSGRRKKRTWTSDGARTYVHTNHCLDDDIAACSSVAPTSTTHDRYDRLAALVRDDPPADVHDVWRHLGDTEGWPRSVCSYMVTPDTPHAMATCGAVAMDLNARVLWACAGLTHGVAPLRFDFEEPA